MIYNILKSPHINLLRFGTLILVGALLAGCAIKPQPSVDVYIEPVEGHVNSNVDTETGAVTIQQKGVAVTIQPLHEVEIFALTDNPHVNPYLFVGNSGNVEPIYTIFEMTVHNLETPRVLVEESAMLMDKSGAQYANLPYDYFEDLYDNVTQSGLKLPPQEHTRIIILRIVVIIHTTKLTWILLHWRKDKLSLQRVCLKVVSCSVGQSDVDL